MASSKETRRVAHGGIAIVKVLPTIDSREDNQALTDFQAMFIARRFRVPAAQASIIAALAFGGQGR